MVSMLSAVPPVAQKCRQLTLPVPLWCRQQQMTVAVYQHKTA